MEITTRIIFITNIYTPHTLPVVDKGDQKEQQESEGEACHLDKECCWIL